MTAPEPLKEYLHFYLTLSDGSKSEVNVNTRLKTGKSSFSFTGWTISNIGHYTCFTPSVRGLSESGIRVIAENLAEELLRIKRIRKNERITRRNKWNMLMCLWLDTVKAIKEAECLPVDPK